MSTDTIEETQVETEEVAVETTDAETPIRRGLSACNVCGWTKSPDCPDPCPNGHASGFGYIDPGFAEGAPVDADTESAAEQEQPETEVVDVEFKELDSFSVATKLALENLYAIQDRLSDAVEDHAEKAEMAKTAKKRVESLQEDLNEAVTKLRHAKDASEPDPKKFPLFDKAKAEINLAFPAPDAIQPTPPDTFAEALRRKQRDTTLLSMGFKASTLKVLTDKHGLKTALDLVNKVTEFGQRNMDLTKMDGITPLRFDEIGEKLEELTGECQAAWKAAHPDEEIPAVEDEDGGDDE